MAPEFAPLLMWAGFIHPAEGSPPVLLTAHIPTCWQGIAAGDELTATIFCKYFYSGLVMKPSEMAHPRQCVPQSKLRQEAGAAWNWDLVKPIRSLHLI
nr:hypothetical protein [uncultured Ottowia sp.]